MSGTNPSWHESAAAAADAPRRLFPLTRHISWRLTPYLAKTPATPNQVTSASLVVGLAAAGLFAQGTYMAAVGASALLVMSYVLDNCDGELARLHRVTSNFGEELDSFADWLIHSAFFIGIGLGVTRQTGDELWIWLGGIAALGGTINYLVVLTIKARSRRRASSHLADEPRSPAPPSASTRDALLFAFRVLARADFCFIVVLAALFDVTWLLLVVGAVGAHAYWASALLEGAQDHHV